MRALALELPPDQWLKLCTADRAGAPRVPLPHELRAYVEHVQDPVLLALPTKAFNRECRARQMPPYAAWLTRCARNRANTAARSKAAVRNTPTQRVIHRTHITARCLQAIKRWRPRRLKPMMPSNVGMLCGRTHQSLEASTINYSTGTTRSFALRR